MSLDSQPIRENCGYDLGASADGASSKEKNEPLF